MSRDWDDDTRDGILFRFWIRAASFVIGGWPSETARALANCHTPADYRRALTELATRRGVNLPEPADADALLKSAGDTAAELRKGLADTLDLVDWALAEGADHRATELTRERRSELRVLAGLETRPDPRGD